MKRWLLLGVLGCGGWGMAGADDASFSRTVRPEDFSAAGLAKLSPEELARLDALVRDFKPGAPAGATLAPADAKAANAEADANANARAVPAAAVKEKKPDSGLLAKAKVLLKPGTEVEYVTTESRLVGDFTGWEGKAIFTLENGERWQLANPVNYANAPEPEGEDRPGVVGRILDDDRGRQPARARRAARHRPIGVAADRWMRRRAALPARSRNAPALRTRPVRS